MKKWYLFYSSSDMFSEMAHMIADSMDLNSLKLQQVGAEISENQKLQQPVAEKLYHLNQSLQENLISM